MLSQISAIVLLASAALGATNTTGDAPRPYVMAKASDAIVSYLVKYRSEGVPVAQASEAAGSIAEGIIKQPAATRLIQSGVSYYMQNGLQVEPSKALSLVNKASSVYDAVATKPSYHSYADFVSSQKSVFDLNRALADASASAIKYSGNSRFNKAAGKAYSKATATISSLKADPYGQAAIQTGKELVSKVANDFHVTAIPTNVKNLRDLKASIQ